MKGTGYPGCEKYSNRFSFVTGHDFSRADETACDCRALAPAEFFQPTALPQRLKPTHLLQLFAARLKSCPVTELFRNGVIPQQAKPTHSNDSNAIALTSLLVEAV
jgi:hypothetical protein